MKTLTKSQAEELFHSWSFWARPDQLAPGSNGAAINRIDWTYWLALAGRGWGKTRCGAEWVIQKAKDNPGSHIALVAATSDDCRKTMLSAGLERVPGASGILAVSPPDFRPVYAPSKRTVTWPNGTVATLYSAEEPDRLRGPQHHFGWADEVAAWANAQDAWDMFLFGLRLGHHPQGCITTTPRPIPIVREMMKDPATVVTRGTTYDNKNNLAPAFFAKIIRKFEGTRLGRQELLADVLEDVPGALWSLAAIDALRVSEAPELVRIVVAIDPAVSSAETSDETGMVVSGLGVDGKGYVLEDASGKYTPNEWTQLAVKMYYKHRADRIVAEVNNGGDLVETAIRAVDPDIPYKALHASRGKRTRAEPVSALYEQGRVHHVGFSVDGQHKTSPMAKLEDQMTTWNPIEDANKSPDRVDALVWSITDLMLRDGAVSWSFGMSDEEIDSIGKRERGAHGEPMGPPIVSSISPMDRLDDMLQDAQDEDFDPFGILG